MFSDDQWRSSRKNGEGCHSSTADKFGRTEKGPCGIGETVQAAGGGDGEMEGQSASDVVVSSLG